MDECNVLLRIILVKLYSAAFLIHLKWCALCIFREPFTEKAVGGIALPVTDMQRDVALILLRTSFVTRRSYSSNRRICNHVFWRF